MLNARNHHEPVLHDSHKKPPALFGKPWFWQRSNNDMEGTRSLARVIMEMQEEIRKLEAQNKMMPKDRKEELDQEQEQTREMFWEEEHENPYGNLRRNASAPVLKGQFKEYKDNVSMTVRRYSMNSSPSGAPRNKQVANLGGRQSHFGWGRIQEEVRSGNDQLDQSATDVVSVSSTKSFQEYLHKTRAKVKTVTFLLPVDDIYTNKPVLPKPQEAAITELAFHN
ncbi:uncharacterized protein LOC130917910 isoform X2 [Corythoichthys intestinalis]|uniref:uncharacterized protein LOC130917910 isoform X2 n=1 Tax=Corythoichthys intestinalis TaxID=161448 RepID=UPI0025A5E444|nr:uncharacterized protein LOC130917910 isoform X2 [Corythoichthys intestinalis]